MINKNIIWREVYRFTIAAIIIWTLLIGFFITQLIIHEKEKSRELAYIMAITNFNKNQAIRLWTASHGGVYVPPTKHTPPNPYLKNIKDRDITTKSGKSLTLMNPAYILRQIMNDYSKLFGIKGMLTSLKTINPANKPDEWQKKALLSFGKGVNEVSNIANINGKPYLRLIRPLIGKKSCLKCHAFQGYKENDLLGGLSVSVPMTSFNAVANETINLTILSYGLLWIVGMGGIAFTTHRAKHRFLQRKQTEKALQESEETHRALIENLSDLIIILDKDGINLWNSNPAKQLGIETADTVGINTREFVHPDDLDRLNTAIDFVVQNPAETVKIEGLKSITPNGKTSYLDVTFKYCPDTPGINGIIAVSKDVTARTMAEESLRESEGNLRSVFDNMQDCFYRTDTVFKIIMISPSVLKLLGYTESEIIGQEIMSFCVKPDEAEILFSELKMNGKVTDYEVTLRKKDNTTIIVSTNSAYWYHSDGSVGGVEGVFRDITKRKQSEKEIQKLSQAVEQSPVSVVITDPNGNIEYVNPKFTDITGYTYEEVIGNNSNMLKSGELSNESYKHMWQTITSGNIWQGEFHNKKKNGDLFWELSSISPIKNQDDIITNYLAIKEDITHRKLVEKELVQHREHLEKLVQERTEELEASNEELESSSRELINTNVELEETTAELTIANEQLNKSIEKEQELSRMKEEFTSNINHELRTPVTGILLTIDYLTESLNKLSTEKIQERLLRIEKSGQILLSLINELLDFSKIEAGQFPFKISSVHLSSIISRIKDTFEEMIHSKKLKLIVPESTDIYFENDPEHIYKIVSNLVSNAYKFTNEGQIELKASENENNIILTVSDTGIGINKDDIKDIFSRFRQGKIHGNKASGTGIGLHMVKQLTEKHGGKVLIESELGKGSTFTIILPKKSTWKKQ